MPKVSYDQFLATIHGRFPNLKGYDETRLFSLLMQAGVNVEFEVASDGTTMINYSEIGPDAGSQLAKL
ncbi:MAG: hypothetical protein HY563_05290 [Ignavibacteriales bacterium]|nr:hypothetical protein [Ignavibacteriales bacterium]